MKKITVELGDRSYPIVIGANLLDSVHLRDYLSGQQVLVVSNELVSPLYMDAVKRSLGGEVDQYVLPDGEQFKTMASLNLILDHLLTNKHNRSTTLVALGGGVVGDITGFAAACYQRGVGFIQVPTTLLAQVDSSVGGKTAVNHAMGKNMIGAFYQPQLVLADTNTLSTLPDREFHAGLAEVIKYGLIQDQPFFEWLEANIQNVLLRGSDCLAYIIEQSCLSKAKIVSEDERESGIRAILNLGHTFGHAIEACHGYGEWLHGEAVAAGMVMAADLSRRLGMLTQLDCDRIVNILAACELPVVPPQGMTSDDFMSKMSLDKKVVDGQLKLILLEKIGQALVTADFDPQILSQTLDFYTSN